MKSFFFLIVVGCIIFGVKSEGKHFLYHQLFSTYPIENLQDVHSENIYIYANKIQNIAKLISLMPTAIAASNMLIITGASQMVIMVKIGSSMFGEHLVIMKWVAMMHSLVLDAAVEVERLRTNLNSTQYSDHTKYQIFFLRSQIYRSCTC